VLSGCAPQLILRCAQVQAACAARGVRIVWVQGLRTWEEQDALYRQGRLTPGKVVTRARGGESWHNFGMAADAAIDADPTRPGLQPLWNRDDPRWWVLIEEIENAGMVSGVHWNDAPHAQYTGRFPVSPTDEVRRIYREHGLEAVWAEAYGKPS